MSSLKQSLPNYTQMLRERAILAEMRGHLARDHLTMWCEIALRPFGQRPAAHHRLLISKLEAVARGEIRKLMVNMPPGSAKSTYASHLFPAWFLAQKDSLNVLAASHTTSLAEQFSRRVQSYARDNAELLGYKLRSESAEVWETGKGGFYRAAGVGTGISGFRADIGLIDDPVRSREAVDNKNQRDKIWDWYRSDFYPRLKPGAAQVVVMTRWHEDDLSGRLLATEPDEWDVVMLRAVAGEDDPLGREPGEMLWSDDGYGYAAQLEEARAFYTANGGMRDWQALYQQEPRPMEGALFHVEQIRTVPDAPAGGKRVRAWDLAATAQTGTSDPDWTVGVLLSRHDDGYLTVLDVVRLRGGPDVVEAAIVNTAMQDGRGVSIDLPQDPGQAGRAQVSYLTKRLMGYRVQSSPETGDKATRAAPVASQCNVGNLRVVSGGWNAAYIDELRGFPSATKDDQVDATSRAFAALVEMPGARKPRVVAARERGFGGAGGWMG